MSEINQEETNWTEQLKALNVGEPPIQRDAKHYDSINTARKRIGATTGAKYNMKQIQGIVYISRKS